jgi:hypothetical protein
VSLATKIRSFVEGAGIERGAVLFEETRTHLPIDFRCVIRDSGITGRSLAHHKAEVVQREAGHEHIATTLGYAKEVENRQGRYGEPYGTGLGCSGGCCTPVRRACDGPSFFGERSTSMSSSVRSATAGFG